MIKLSVDPKKQSAARNLTTEELIAHIRWEFPNLAGSLAILLDRLERRCVGCDYASDSVDHEYVTDHKCKCPKCGTDLNVTVED